MFENLYVPKSFRISEMKNVNLLIDRSLIFFKKNWN